MKKNITMDNRFSEKLRLAVEAIARALDDDGINLAGHAFGPNQFIFDEVGTVGDCPFTGNLTVSYDLHVSDETKAIIAIALKDFENVRYDTGGRYRDIYGQWFVNEAAFITYAKDLLQVSTETEDQMALFSLLFPEKSKAKANPTSH